jgi:anti-sigma regulatory factor (Ser/Thr protein kinase)
MDLVFRFAIGGAARNEATGPMISETGASCQNVVREFADVDDMVSGEALAPRLEELVRRALLPQRFPVLRDVELAASVIDAGGGVCFYDHYWSDNHLLVASAIRLRRDGLGGALAASALRQLLRALVSALGSPAVVIARLAEHFEAADGVDAAVLRLDTSTGEAQWAMTGEAGVSLPGGGKRRAAVRVEPGTMVWVTAGPIKAPSGASVPIEGLQPLVEQSLERLDGPGVACAVLFKACARVRDSETFIMANSQEEIPVLLERLQRFFSRHGLSDEDVAGVEVALDEILTNAVNYAFADGNGHEIVVSMTAAPSMLSIEIRDDGSPFDPLGVPAPDLEGDIEDRQVGGLGMHFVRELLDRVSYSRSEGWNVLTLEKNLRGSGGAPA